MLKRVSPEADQTIRGCVWHSQLNFTVSGVYAIFSRMRRFAFDEGSAFSEADDFTHTRVAFIGADLKKKLFSGQNAIGENIRVDGISYQVVGVLKHVINNNDENLNGHVYLPFSAMSDLKTPTTSTPLSWNMRAITPRW